MESKIQMKSLQDFKENCLVHIVPFRYNGKALEILLHKQPESGFYDIFSDFRHEFEPTCIFAAARILMKQIYGKSFALKENEDNWIDPLFQKISTLVGSSYENIQTPENVFYFICENDWNQEILNPECETIWINCQELPQLTFSKTFLENLKRFNFDAHLQYQPKQQYGIINCESNPKWEGIYEGLFTGYLQKEHEQWASFNVAKDVFPSEDDIKRTVGWVINGSASATYEDKPWIKKLFKLITDIEEIKGSKTRQLGICFGHQALAKAFGGETESMKRKDGMLMIKQRIIFNENALEKEYFKKSGVSPELLVKEGLLINQAHGDHVSKLPPKAELLASSDNTKVEVFCIGDQVLGIQPHPEFCDVLMSYKLINYKSNLSPEAKKILCQSYTEWDLHNKELIKICREFLNS